MSHNNTSVVRHDNNGYYSDDTVDSQDEPVASCSSGQPIALSSAVNNLSDALSSSRIRVKDCQNIQVGNKNYFHGPVTLICAEKTCAKSEHCTQLKSDLKPLEPVDNTLELISRGEWLARPPKKPPTKLQLPATKVIIQHTATNHELTKVNNSIF